MYFYEKIKMNYPIQADIIPFIKHVVEACYPFAQAQSVTLHFETPKKTLIVQYNPEEIIADLTQLICRIVTFTPQNQDLQNH